MKGNIKYIIQAKWGFPAVALYDHVWSFMVLKQLVYYLMYTKNYVTDKVIRKLSQLSEKLLENFVTYFLVNVYPCIIEYIIYDFFLFPPLASHLIYVLILYNVFFFQLF